MKNLLSAILLIALTCLAVVKIEQANETIIHQSTAIANLEYRLNAYRYDMQRAQPYIKVDTMFAGGRPATIIVKVRRPVLLDPSILMLAATPEDSGSWSIRVVERGEEDVK